MQIQMVFHGYKLLKIFKIEYKETILIMINKYATYFKTRIIFSQ
jgi:hypothetical protein